MEGFLCHCHHHNYPNSKDCTCGCNDLLFSEGQMTKAMFHHQAYETVRVEYKIMCCSFLISNESMHSSDLQMHSKTGSEGLANHNS
jgi:hypothetical protein